MAKRASPTKTRPPQEPGEPEEPEDFELIARGSIRWAIDGTEFTLKGPMLVGDWRDLEEMRIDRANDARLRLTRALAMPQETEEQQDAQLEALRQGRKLDAAEYDAWYSELFTRACGTVPDLGLLPAYAHTPAMLERILIQLRGPLPRGVA